MRITLVVLLLVCALVIDPADAGELDPPAGPIAATDRQTLNTQEIGNLPYTITEPGSYVLTSDLRDCLECSDLPSYGLIIDASHVTVDLNGFSIYGDRVSSIDGIVALSGRTDITVKNGVVRDWLGDGIDLRLAINSRVENIRVSNCGADGVRTGFGSVVEGCTVTNCLGSGAVVELACVVENCTAVGCGVDGFHALPVGTSNGSVFRSCAARLNGQDGIDAADGCVVSACAVSLNGGHGVLAAPGCVVENCSATVNTLNGIDATGSLVRGNSALNNSGAGIAGAGSTLVENHAP